MTRYRTGTGKKRKIRVVTETRIKYRYPEREEFNNLRKFYPRILEGMFPFISKWDDTGFHPLQIIEFMSMNIWPEEALEWSKCNIEPWQIYVLKMELGLSLNEIKRVTETDFWASVVLCAASDAPKLPVYSGNLHEWLLTVNNLVEDADPDHDYEATNIIKRGMLRFSEESISAVFN